MELTWEQAADAADAFLADEAPGTVVLRDPVDVFQDDNVFVFLRIPMAVDDQLLVVEKSDGTVKLVVDSPFGRNPYPLLEPVEAED